MPEYKYDFERIRAEVLVPAVLARYGVEVVKDHCTCPLPNHKGERKNRCMSVFANGKAWKCHSCNVAGNALSLVKLMEDCEAQEAARKLYGWFLNGQEAPAAPEPVEAAEGPINPPLKFELKNIQHEHPYLTERGFSPELCERFGVGFYRSKQGTASMHNRIVFPIHRDDDLIAYAGRDVTGEAEKRWSLPLGFRRGHVLYNLNRVEGESVVVCESFWGPLACYRAGIENAVALMGDGITDEQLALLSRFRFVTLVMDGDGPGRAASKNVGVKLLELDATVKVVRLPDDAQPDTMDPEELTLAIW